MYRTQTEAEMVTNHKGNKRQLCFSEKIALLSEVTLSKIEEFSRIISTLWILRKSFSFALPHLGVMLHPFKYLSLT